MIFVILIVVGILLFFILKKVKKIRLADVTMVTGGVKTGKSTLALFLARKEYKKRLLKYYFRKPFLWLFGKKAEEKPLFYSNIPLGFDYVPLTEDILLRKKRINYKSVVYVSEASLIADSMDFKDGLLNENLKMFNKLFGHSTKGGFLIYDTQAVKDVHHAIKRCLNSFYWIHHGIKWIPFFYVVKCREIFYSEENGVQNVFNEDIDETTKTIFVPKRIWKKFDCYCYSVLTDSLPVENTIRHAITKNDLKCSDILSVKGVKNEKKKNV